MDALSKFYKELSSLAPSTEELTISQAREVVRKINEFLYCSDPSNGKTYALGMNISQTFISIGRSITKRF